VTVTPGYRAMLPPQDVLMAAILLLLMLMTSTVAAISGGVEGPIPWVALLAMPVTLILIWLSYTAAVLMIRFRSPAGFARAENAVSGFMGKTLVMAGITVTLAHGGMLAAYTGLLQGEETELMLRLVFVGLGLNLAYMHNLMPKLASKAMGHGPDLRLIGWVGTLCCLAMAVAGAVMPIGAMAPVYIGLGMVSPTLVLISTALRWINRKPTG
jgi:hypothetical protein